MENVKIFITNFFESEAKARFCRFRPDLNKFNESLYKMNSYLTEDMIGRMGLVKMTKLNDDSFYERKKKIEALNPRHLFKISHYKHAVYNEVWVAYTSVTNPDLDIPLLSHAFFIIKEEGEYKLARNYIYSDEGGMSKELGWEGFSGIQDLTFESLGDFIAVERYLEPLDFDNGLTLYNEEA